MHTEPTREQIIQASEQWRDILSLRAHIAEIREVLRQRQGALEALEEKAVAASMAYEVLERHGLLADGDDGQPDAAVRR